MRAFFIYLTLAFLPVSSFAELEWETTRLDLKAKLGVKNLTGIYKFTNTGSDTVEIISVKANCGCTTPSLDKKVYAPGESGEIKAIFDVGSRVGPQHKTITVATVGGKRYSLILKTTIPTLLTIQPRVLFWTQNSENTPKKVDIKVSIKELVDVAVLTESSTFRAELETIEAGKHYTLTVTPRYTAEAARKEITIRCNYPEKNPVSYKIFAYIKNIPKKVK